MAIGGGAIGGAAIGGMAIGGGIDGPMGGTEGAVGGLATPGGGPDSARGDGRVGPNVGTAGASATAVGSSGSGSCGSMDRQPPINKPPTNATLASAVNARFAMPGLLPRLPPRALARHERPIETVPGRALPTAEFLRGPRA